MLESEIGDTRDDIGHDDNQNAVLEGAAPDLDGAVDDACDGVGRHELGPATSQVTPVGMS